MLALAPARLAEPPDGAGRTLFPAQGQRKGRWRCSTAASRRSSAIGPGGRHPGADPARDRGRAGARQGCCGGIVHHMGREDAALAAARRNVEAWTFELGGEGSTPF